MIPQYEEAHKRAVFKAAAIVKGTKKSLESLDDKDLSDIRSMQKPDSEIEDLLAAIIIIGKLSIIIITCNYSMISRTIVSREGKSLWWSAQIDYSKILY